MTCRDLDVLVSLHAAGALDAAEAARVEAHLADCAACRATAQDLAAALDLARLPPPTDAERRAFQDLGARTLASLRRASRVRLLAKRIGAGLAAAAAAAAVLLAPAVLRKRVDAPAAAQAVWQQPDLDTIWSEASALDLGASSYGDAQDSDDGDADAALAALDL